VARVWPSGEKASAATQEVCPRKATRCLPVSTSQSVTAPTSVPTASVLPPGENATDRTFIIDGFWENCSFTVAVATSHTMTHGNGYPAASSFPSGENSAQWTESWFASEGGGFITRACRVATSHSVTVLSPRHAQNPASIFPSPDRANLGAISAS